MNHLSLQSSVRRLAVAAGVAAALTWVVVQSAYPFFVSSAVPKVSSGRGPIAPTAKEIAEGNRLKHLNPAVLLAVAGGLLGVAVALGEGASRRSATFTLSATLCGASFGALFGAAGGYGGQWLLSAHWLLMTGEPWRMMAVQMAAWGVTELGVGLGLALPLRRSALAVRGSVGGGVAGLFSGLAYSLLSSVTGVFRTTGDGDSVVPDDAVDQAIWLAAAAICTSALTAGLLRRRAVPTSDA